VRFPPRERNVITIDDTIKSSPKDSDIVSPYNILFISILRYRSVSFAHLIRGPAPNRYSSFSPVGFPHGQFRKILVSFTRFYLPTCTANFLIVLWSSLTGLQEFKGSNLNLTLPWKQGIKEILQLWRCSNCKRYTRHPLEGGYQECDSSIKA
jgi:hypothetical protein